MGSCKEIAVAEGKMKLTLVALCAVLLAYNVRALPVEGNEVGEEKICIAGYCCGKEESIGEGLTVGEEENICMFGYCCKKEEKNLKEILAPSATAGIEVEKTFACSDIAARRKNLPRMDSMLEKRRFALLDTVASRRRRRHEKKKLEMEQRSTTNGIFIYHLPTN